MNIILTNDEIEALTGYQWPSKQLNALQQQGFFRARLGIAGNVLLERVHYEAVCRGTFAKPEISRKPQVRMPQIRSAT